MAFPLQGFPPPGVSGRRRALDAAWLWHLDDTREAATPWCHCTYGCVWLCENEIGSGHNAVVILLTERELLFRLSYPLPYEDEIRSVEGPDASRGGPRRTRPALLGRLPHGFCRSTAASDPWLRPLS